MFKQRRNRKFNYQPRFAKDGEPREEREDSFASKWNRERDMNLGKGKRGFSLKTLILILVLLLICMYWLEKKIM